MGSASLDPAAVAVRLPVLELLDEGCSPGCKPTPVGGAASPLHFRYIDDSNMLKTLQMDKIVNNAKLKRCQ